MNELSRQITNDSVIRVGRRKERKEAVCWIFQLKEPPCIPAQAFPIAARNNWSDVFRIFLELGLDTEQYELHVFERRFPLALTLRLVSEQNDDRKSAIDYSVELGHNACARIVLEQCVNWSEPWLGGYHKRNTLLIIVAQNGHVGIVELFLEHNKATDFASISIRDAIRRSIKSAEPYPYFDLEQLEEKRMPLDVTDHTGLTPLATAAKQGHTRIVDMLVRPAYYSLEKADIEQRTPLSLAAFYGHSKCVTTLVEHRADLEARDIRGQTPLALNCFSKPSNIAERLLEEGARVDTQDNRQRTPLMEAASFSEATTECDETPDRGLVRDLVHCLFQHGANLGLSDESGVTAVAYARDTKGMTPSTHAVANNRTEAVTKLPDVRRKHRGS
jgi:ankyrin repeat protein